MSTSHPQRRRAWRRDDGRADRRALRQCGCARAAARRHRGGGARRPRARAGAQAGSVLHARPARRSIRTGSFDDDLPASRPGDWILEAIVERLDVKQALFARVEQYRAPHAIVSSNTSGIPIAALAEGRSAGVQGALARHAFLQSAALSPAARGHPDARHRSGRRRHRDRVRRPPAGQGRRRREGHAELHRQPHRALRRDADPPCAGDAASTRSKRSMRSPGRRSAARRARRSARWTSPASTSSRTWSAILPRPSNERTTRRSSICRSSSRTWSPGVGSAPSPARASTRKTPAARS